MNSRPNLLIVSHVPVFPLNSGQSLRVFYTLQAAREQFHVTYLTFAPQKDIKRVSEELSAHADEVIVLPSVYHSGRLKKTFLKAAGKVYTLATGLKFSNFLIGKYELTPARIEKAVKGRNFDLYLFEYWHAHKAAAHLKAKGKKVLLDSHNILWQTYKRQYDLKVPAFVRSYHQKSYLRTEEKAWLDFSGIVSINRNEDNYFRDNLPKGAPLFYMPMGISIAEWPERQSLPAVPRLAYYGGMSVAHNRESALFCAREVMPLVWKHIPECEFWIIGSSPNDEIRQLQSDPRIKVTGFVQDVSPVLQSVSVMLCPWKGTYGFRSRLVEVMAGGVPVISSRDAVYGMEMEEGEGISFAESAAEFADKAINLLSDADLLQRESRKARQQTERKFSFENTYRKGLTEINGWLTK